MSSKDPGSSSHEQKSSWYLLTGFILGLVIGLVISWVVMPVTYGDIAPSMLESVGKKQYRLMIAMAYTVDQDLVRAESRLGLLEDADATELLVAQSQQWLAEGRDQAEVQALASLAAAIELSDPTGQ